MDLQGIEKATRELLLALGEDPDRPGLLETPKRVARMYAEVLEGVQYSNDDIVDMYNKCFDEPTARDLVVMANIPAFSFCEHHIALMYNMKISVGYIPEGRVVGLSKIARVVSMITKRLQLQERIGEDVAYVIEKICATHNVMVVISAEHACMTSRGVCKPGVATKTAVVHGLFRDSQSLRQEVYNLIKE